MKASHIIRIIIRWAIALVWFINGAYCKVLDLVPRHRQIVGTILGHDHERIFTLLIGCGEIFVGIWIISNIKARMCAWFQIILIATMNIMEFILVPDLLLFGRMNIILALLFMLFIYSTQIKKLYEKNKVKKQKVQKPASASLLNL